MVGLARGLSCGNLSQPAELLRCPLSMASHPPASMVAFRDSNTEKGMFVHSTRYWLRVPACVSTSSGPFPNSLGQIVPFSRPKITRKARLANHFGYWRRAQGGSLDPYGQKMRSTMFPQTRRHRILLLLIVETPRAKQTRYCERYVKLHLAR